MTTKAISKIHAAMAAKGYVHLAAAARALRISKPTASRLAHALKPNTRVKHGSTLYVLWAPLRLASGPSADLLDVPKTAADVLKN